MGRENRFGGRGCHTGDMDGVGDNYLGRHDGYYWELIEVRCNLQSSGFMKAGLYE